MTYIALIRHGQTDWNRAGRIQGSTDIPLNETGLAQAQATAAKLSQADWPTRWSYATSSHLSRAVHTAQIIAQHLEIPLLDPKPGLAERDYGKAEGRLAIEAHQEYGADYPEAEPTDQVVDRGLKVISDLAQEFPGAGILAISHGGLIRRVLQALGHDPVAPLENASISLLHQPTPGASWEVLMVNNDWLAK